MSTFLELVVDLHRESGASGQSPNSVSAQFGEQARLVRWVKQANDYVQNLFHNWKFLRREFVQSTAEGVQTLASPLDHQYWDFDTFRVDGEIVEAVEYDDVKTEVVDTSPGKPSRITVMPDSSLRFEPTPDRTYSITADYYRKPVPLVNNGDISVIPTQYHPVILGRALILYANYENAREIQEQGGAIYSEMLSRLEAHQLPNQTYASYAPRKGGGFEVIAE